MLKVAAAMGYPDAEVVVEECWIRDLPFVQWWAAGRCMWQK